MNIGSFDTGKKTLIIAEIGNNHEGNFDVAKKLVHQAAKSRVDAVKFQTFRTEHFIDRTQTERFAQLKSYELTAEQFRELGSLARSLGLLYISTPFDMDSVGLLEPLVDAFKISSGDLPFYPLISRVIRTGKPTILSTGASDFSMIDRAVNLIKRESTGRWTDQTALLHCVSSYPAPDDQVSLRAITAMAARFPCSIGYSDHTLGIEAAVAAVALNAQIIEKHFTLDKNYSSFRDHKLSADPDEMSRLVQRIRALEPMLGAEKKEIQPCEAANATSMRRSIVAARDLKEGAVLQSNDLEWTRPAGGLAPGEEELLIGKHLKRAIHAGHRFQASDVS